jgi:hypothetical protein
MIMELPDFLIIPSILIMDKNLQPLDGQVYGVIYWYTKLYMKKCILSNAKIAELLGANPQSISNSITRLVRGKYVIAPRDDYNHRLELIPTLAFTPPNLSFDSQKKSKKVMTKKKKLATNDIVSTPTSNDVPPPTLNDLPPYIKSFPPPTSNDVHNKRSLIREVNKTTTNVVEETFVSLVNVDNSSKEMTEAEKTEKVDKRKPEIDECIKYFLIKLGIPKEDCTQRQSRQYWWLLLKESKTGPAGVKWLIDKVAADKFYKNNCTSSKDLFYMRIKIVARARGEQPKVAVMPQEEGGGTHGQQKLEIDNRQEPLLSN